MPRILLALLFALNATLDGGRSAGNTTGPLAGSRAGWTSGGSPADEGVRPPRTEKPTPFRLSQPAEVTAKLEMESPGSDWAVAGREAAMADVLLDDAVQQQVMLYAGASRHTYTIFLGTLAAGEHRLQIVRNAKYSAAGSGLAVHGVQFREVRRDDPYYAVLANAPVLYARENTVGRFSDVPMMIYCERVPIDGKPALQYTVIFSNEDGGTSTRALMARWGRTTDIEYVFRGPLDGSGVLSEALIQTRDHKEAAFDGRRFGVHPILTPVTDNNMVAGNVVSPIRYQIVPVEVDLTHATRESVMDTEPVTWTVMAKELEREAKLRPYGTVDGEKIGDLRHYLYIDFRATLHEASVAAFVKLKDERLWRSSNLGRVDLDIARNGWVRTTIELPPGTKREQIEEIAFACHASTTNKTAAGRCRVEEINSAFLWNGGKLTPKGGFEIPAGQMRAAPAQ